MASGSSGSVGLKTIVEAAGEYLGVNDLTVEMLHDMLVMSWLSLSCDGMPEALLGMVKN